MEMRWFFCRCIIDLNEFEREKTHAIWKDLPNSKGSIFLLLTISGTTETISDLSNCEFSSREREALLKRYVSNPFQMLSIFSFMCCFFHV